MDLTHVLTELYLSVSFLWDANLNGTVSLIPSFNNLFIAGIQKSDCLLCINFVA